MRCFEAPELRSVEQKSLLPKSPRVSITCVKQQPFATKRDEDLPSEAVLPVPPEALACSVQPSGHLAARPR